MTPPPSLAAGAFGVVSAPPSVQIEDARCPLGCPRDDRLVLLASDRRHHIPGRYPIVRCASCGLMRTNPRPTPSLGRDRGWVRWPSYVEAIGDGRRQVGARPALGAILGWLRASGRMTLWARRA